MLVLLNIMKYIPDLLDKVQEGLQLFFPAKKYSSYLTDGDLNATFAEERQISNADVYH